MRACFQILTQRDCGLATISVMVSAIRMLKLRHPEDEGILPDPDSKYCGLAMISVMVSAMVWL